jgi:RND family efflux transporter MFP subunit
LSAQLSAQLSAAVALIAIGSLTSSGESSSAQHQDPVRRPTARPYAVGVSRPSHVAAIAAEQAGTIVELPVAQGEVVTEGKIVFRLSSKIQQLRVDRLVTLTKSDLTVRRALAAFEHSSRLKARLAQLSEKNITSDAEIQDRELDAMLAKLKYEQSVIDQDLIKNELEQARVLLDQRTIRSPMSGVVTELFKQRGDTTEKLVPVLEVARLDPLWVEFECPVKDKALYRLDAKVELRPWARPEESREGTVVFVSMRANPSSHTFRVRVATPNKGHTWKAGLKMQIALPKQAAAATEPKPPPK